MLRYLLNNDPVAWNIFFNNASTYIKRIEHQLAKRTPVEILRNGRAYLDVPGIYWKWMDFYLVTPNFTFGALSTKADEEFVITTSSEIDIYKRNEAVLQQKSVPDNFSNWDKITTSKRDRRSLKGTFIIWTTKPSFFQLIYRNIASKELVSPGFDPDDNVDIAFLTEEI